MIPDNEFTRDTENQPSMDEAYHKSLNIHRSILTEANRLVHEDRSEAYDHPLDNFTRTAKLWQVALEKVLKVDAVITPEMVGICLLLLKVARELHCQKRDNLVDAAGYAEAVAWVIHEKEKRKVSVDFVRKQMRYSQDTSEQETVGSVPSVEDLPQLSR
jgi:hypothetical protein